MSIGSNLFTGAAGLNSHGDAITVTGDNVANANTVGFKRSRANFEDMLVRSTLDPDIGLGSRMVTAQQMMGQGALQSTGSATDMAIKGNGFFCVRGSAGGLTGSFYTRAGQFHLDKDGKLVNEAGLVARGYLANTKGVIQKKVEDVKVPMNQMAPAATAKVTVYGNLNASTSAPSAAWSTTAPTTTSNFSTQVTTYDSLGKAHVVNVFFRKESTAGAWSWYALVDGAEITGGTSGTYEQEASGSLTFDTSGRLDTETTTASSFGWANAVTATLAFDWGDSITTDSGTGLKGMTWFSSTSSISYANQDGNSSGNMSGISVDATGVISGVFSNGKKRTVGQLLLADFKSQQDLKRIGGNLYAESDKSGQSLLRTAAAGGMGTIAAGNLEQSNVDLAKEFVNLIAFQRGFQANSRSVTTSDQLLQELLALKR